MSNPSVSSAPADAWAFVPDRYCLFSLLLKAIERHEFAQASYADDFSSLYADGRGIADWAILQYRHHKSLVTAYRARVSQLSHMIFKD